MHKGTKIYILVIQASNFRCNRCLDQEKNITETLYPTQQQKTRQIFNNLHL